MTAFTGCALTLMPTASDLRPGNNSCNNSTRHYFAFMSIDNTSNINELPRGREEMNEFFYEPNQECAKIV
ncbi:35820_t:CDS:2 [Racocetra persica]|uniref:35820_t:CDS:1 n=1 Tax=Racocetra persica TaxID=160502 RepID=A0ACA9P2N0_9GLOM|nr:35820_t:CDS:2 [Racocetra persica]